MQVILKCIGSTCFNAFSKGWNLSLCLSVLQLAMRGPPGPMGLTGRSGPVVSLSVLFCFIFVVAVQESLSFFIFKLIAISLLLSLGI